MAISTDAVAMEVFWRIHQGLAQQAPGSDDSTRRALQMLPALPPEPEILDLGCGPGRHSVLLARETGGNLTAIDLIPSFLQQVDDRAAAAQLGDRIVTRERSMDDLDYEDQSFDLLWSEGAIYNIGFETGLREWRRLLRPNGCVAVSELTWLTDDPPAHIDEYWQKHYPSMQSHGANELAVTRAGYQLLDSFVMPDSDWWDYYGPIDPRIALLRKERDDDAWLAAVNDAALESSIVSEGLDAFGYVFYLMRRVG